MTLRVDQALEAEYALRSRHPERDDVYARHLERGARARAGAGCALDLRYGAGPRATLDIYPAARDAPVLFFVHGGYWRALDKSYVAFIAEAYRRAGLTVVTPGYDLAPTLRVGEIVEQIREAFAFAMKRLAPREVVVAGHSAGAQLAAMLALDQAERGGGPIVGLVGVSGVFDLRPLLRTSINGDLKLSPEEAEDASPLLRLAKLGAGRLLPPLLAFVGGLETDGFKDWTIDFADRWRAHGGGSERLQVEGATHFTILDHLADPRDSAHRAILDLCSVDNLEHDHA